MKNNSKLLITGYWLNTRGLLECKLGNVHFIKSIDEIKIPKNMAFLIVPYHKAKETLNISVKEEKDMEIIYAEIEDILPYERKKGFYELYFKDIADNKKSFIDKVKYIKEEIEKGTIYQVNLTTRMEFITEGDHESLFLEYFNRQPVPYGFFFKFEDLTVISGSMELFLKKEGKKIISSPIKGTAKERKTLEKSIKDRAENLMITDMVRNDLGRIALKGSVKVTELFKIVEYRTLYQMHSTVEALTESNINEILKATFPPASVTGAPKRKAVEIIDRIEGFPRGYYCGCGGILKNNGDFTLSVLIRTAVGVGDKLYYYAGCGIVWDSDPEREFEELMLKTKALYDPPPDP